MSIGNPLLPLGSLNRLLTNAIFPSNPILNVTPSYLGKKMISLSFDGNVTDIVEVAVGTVNSPCPYVMATINLNLLKTTGLASSYKTFMENSSIVGTVNLIPDSSTLPSYSINNCCIMSISELNFAGSNDDFDVKIRGFYVVNNSLWTG